MGATVVTMQRSRQAAVFGAATLLLAGVTAAALIFTRMSSPGAGRLSPSAWSAVAVPSIGGRTDLRGVACTGRDACIAVGSSTSAGLPTALVERWDGAQWSIAQSETRGVDSWLNSVACPAPGWCVAVGGDSPTGDSDNPLDQTLVETLVGATWAVVPSPTPGNGDQNDLQSVTCTSPTFCMAVGSFSPVSNPYDPEVDTLAEVWDGVKWSALPSSNPTGGRQNVLQSAACTSPTWCVAVGSTSSIATSGNSVGHALVEQWDGGSWRTMPTPASNLGRKSALQSVSCSSAASCFAVGSFSPGSHPERPDDRTLAERWNGAAWSVVATPNPPMVMQNSLRAVNCTSPEACVAVGTASSGADLENTAGLIESWSGAGWAIVPSVNSNAELASIACLPRGSCTVVGKAVPPTTTTSQWQTFIEISVTS